MPMGHNGWVYIEVVRGCYGLSQSEILANTLIHIRLNKKGYFEATTIPGLWKHKWQPIQFFLIMDNFGIEYVGERHIHNLRDVLKQHYKIAEDLAGTKFSGIYIEWNYAPNHVELTCRLCIRESINDLLLRFGHKPPSKPHLSPQ